MQTPQGILEPSGARISVEASLWARFEGDKAREVHHYLDVLTLLQQIGAMPGPPAWRPSAWRQTVEVASRVCVGFVDDDGDAEPAGFSVLHERSRGTCLRPGDHSVIDEEHAVAWSHGPS
jgi:hypothetical protein